MLDATAQKRAAAPEDGVDPTLAEQDCEPAMKFVPVNVMVLLRYALLGTTVLLKVGKSKIVNPVPGDETKTDEGFSIVTSIALLPKMPNEMDEGIFIRMLLEEDTKQNDAETLKLKLGPITALQV